MTEKNTKASSPAAASKSKKSTPNRFVERIRDKALGVNIFTSRNSGGVWHFGEISKAVPGKRDADDNVVEWNHTTRLKAADFRKLESLAGTAAARLESLEAESADTEEYPQEDAKAAA